MSRFSENGPETNYGAVLGEIQDNSEMVLDTVSQDIENDITTGG